MQQIGKIELERKGNELELAINWGSIGDSGGGSGRDKQTRQEINEMKNKEQTEG